MGHVRIPPRSMMAAAVAGILTIPAGTAVRAQSAIDWRPYFTLAPGEGLAFSADSVRVLPSVANSGVPGLNVANDGRVILGYGGAPGGRGAAVSADGGRTFTPLSGVQRPMQVDGGFVYLPDGRTRFVTEEPSPNSTPARHRSRIVSCPNAHQRHARLNG